MDSSKKSVGKTKIVEDIKKFATKKDKASSSSKSKVPIFRMNESRIAPPGPIEFSSSTPSLIPTHELMERIYGSNNQSLNYINESLPEEEEFVEEEDLDDIPTSPNFDSTEAPP